MTTTTDTTDTTDTAATRGGRRARKKPSPIIEPGLQPAALSCVLAALLAAGSAFHALVVAVAVLQVLTSAGWFRLNGMWPARQGIALAALLGFVADGVVLAGAGVAGLLGVLGAGCVLVLVLQTLRPTDPSERMYALTVLGSATLLSVLCGALLLADHVPAAVTAVGVAVLVAALPMARPAALLAALVLAVGAGLVAGATPAVAALAAVGGLIGRRVASYDFPSRFVHFTAGVALPLAIAAPLVWLGSRLL